MDLFQHNASLRFLRAACGLAILLTVPARSANPPYFNITVVDEQTGRGVPLVQLETVNNIRYHTDSNGVVAFYEPGLMNTTVYFHLSSHGYELPKDGFGYAGKALKITEGGTGRIAIHRINVAERLYRVTGQGIYRDTLLVGDTPPTSHPVLNGLVLGSDSIVNAIYHNKLYWFWGDTNRAAYPLGNFSVTGATSLLPGSGGLDPAAGVDLTYFVDGSGFAKAMAPVPGDGPTWIFGLVTLKDTAGVERMVAYYVKIRNSLDAYERGLVQYNDEKQQFEKVAQFPMDLPGYPGGQAMERVEGGTRYIYFVQPYPLLRIPATLEGLKDPSWWESFTCLKEGTRLAAAQIDRAPDGAIRYGWKRNTPSLGPKEEAKLVHGGQLKPGEALLHLQEPDTGKAVTAHASSVFWNEYRKRWVMITCESGGTSLLGETWFAEADTPLGPWVYARKIVTHHNYTFYNPKQHPYFDQQGGRLIYFEGTYTSTFSGNPDVTPRYDYNQMMYRLDLSDPRLSLPVPFYQAEAGSIPQRPAALPPDKDTTLPPPAFFALDRPGPGAIPIYRREAPGAPATLKASPSETAPNSHNPILFYALPPDAAHPPAGAIPLYEFEKENSPTRAYSTDLHYQSPGYHNPGKPLCLVWPSPLTIHLPRE